MANYDLIKQITEGEFPFESVPDHKGEISSRFFEKVEKSGVNFDELLKTTLDDISRVYMFKRFFEWVPYADSDLNSYRKSDKISSILREVGIVAYNQKNMKEALKYYNLAITYAPHDSKKASTTESNGNGCSTGNENNDVKYSKQLLICVAERSKILVQVRGGEEALRDVNFLLGLLGETGKENESEFLSSLRAELLGRKAECDKFLEEKSSFMQELAKDSLEEMEKRQKYKNLLLFKIKKANPVAPAAESFVEIRVDPVKGRQLVLNRDIPAGLGCLGCYMYKQTGKIGQEIIAFIERYFKST